MLMPRNAYRSCPVCSHYLDRRATVLEPAIAFQAFIRGVGAGVVLHEYLTAVHDRHLAGDTLSTRPWTPDYIDLGGATHVRVKRACNGCGDRLGDATLDELDAAVDGLPLPDVRIECGCWSAAA